MFLTDADRLRFLLETEAELCAFLADEALETEASEDRPQWVSCRDGKVFFDQLSVPMS